MRHLLYRFDALLIDRIKRLPQWAELALKIISASAFPFVTLGLIVPSIFVFGTTHHNDIIIYAAGFIVVTHAVSSLLKVLFRRTRPATYVRKPWTIQTYSFPSGHATSATIAYGTIGVIALYGGLSSVGVVVGLLTVWVFLVGISRVYLGAHYPSDVIAGWLLGGIGLLCTSGIMGLL